MIQIDAKFINAKINEDIIIHLWWIIVSLEYNCNLTSRSKSTEHTYESRKYADDI